MSPSSFELTVVRHGQTDGNKANLMQGSTDTSLSELGVKQADAAGQALQDSKWTHVFTSDLKRTHQTADGILAHYKGDPKYSREIDPRIRERHFGDSEGVHFKDFIKAKEEAEKEGNKSYVPKNGETLEAIRERFQSFFQDMCDKVIEAKGSDANVLVVTHGGFYHYYHNSYMIEKYDMQLPPNYISTDHAKNTAISKYDVLYDSKTLKVTKLICKIYNNTDHYKLIQ